MTRWREGPRPGRAAAQGWTPAGGDSESESTAGRVTVTSRRFKSSLPKRLRVTGSHGRVSASLSAFKLRPSLRVARAPGTVTVPASTARDGPGRRPTELGRDGPSPQMSE